jgi:hypothetical protein
MSTAILRSEGLGWVIHPPNASKALLANTEGQKWHSVRGFRCEACGLTFHGANGFTLHRVGRFASGEKANTRRCLTRAELEARGFQLSATGQWASGYAGPKAA